MPSSDTFTAWASNVGPRAPPTSTSASNGIRVAPGARRSSVLISSSVVLPFAIENPREEGQVFMAAHLVLDIETIPDPELPRTDDSDRVPPPPFNQIVTLGCLLLEDHVPKRLGVLGEGKTEGEMLEAFAEWLDTRQPTVVTWNGRSFDMPVITSRALKHGVPMPWWFRDRNTRYRYSTDGHFDLMDFLADFGATKNARLDAYARIVGFPG